MNTKAKGEITQGIILAHLLKQGKTVLLPFGDNQRYDLVIDEGGTFVRVQCKTARLQAGIIRFNTASSYAHRGGGWRSYRGSADVFIVYCPETDKVYQVPVDDVSEREAWLRVDPPRHNLKNGSRFAKDYEI